MQRLGLIMAWLAATVVATILAFGAVSFVAGDLEQGPRPLAAATSTTSSATSPVATSSVPTSVAPSAPTTVTTEVEGPSSTSSATDSTSSTTSTTQPESTSSTTPSSSTTSTTVPDDGPTDSEVIATAGGTAELACFGSIPRILNVWPEFGFLADPEVESDKVRVEFESTSTEEEYKVVGRCENGQLAWEVEQS